VVDIVILYIARFYRRPLKYAIACRYPLVDFFLVLEDTSGLVTPEVTDWFAISAMKRM
jgi:hypothetical protein